jgi:peptidoglycan/LPS O-acetylase OafA/YrhL
MTQLAHTFANSVRIRDGHDNFFTPLRLIFALLVMVGHAFAIYAGDGDSEPHVFFRYTFSYLAVNLFFIASGFLVTGSMVFRGDKTAFVAARVLRIFPALIVHVLLVMLVVGPLATSLPLTAYFMDPGLWLEPFKVLSFVNTDMILPGAFETNGEQYGSAPLWTLRFEILCYIATLLAFSLGLMKRRWMVLAQFILPSLVWMIGLSFDLFSVLPGSVENMVRFGIAYGLGATLFAYREKLTLHWVMLPALFGLCVIARGSAAMEVIVNLFLACGVMLVTFVRVPKLNILKKLDDVSYGIYIYHWAVMQLAFYWFPDLSVTTLFMIALPIVITLAWMSWIFVEKPMLAYKKPFGEWLRFGRNRTAFDASTVLLD